MAASSALEVAVAIALAANGGRACSMSSIGLPTILARRAAKLGCSRASTARFSAVRSSGVISLFSGHDPLCRELHGAPIENFLSPNLSEHNLIIPLCLKPFGINNALAMWAEFSSPTPSASDPSLRDRCQYEYDYS